MNNKRSKEEIKDILRQRKKDSKLLLKEKRARLLVKNLPFTTTEENLREHFEKYGEISNVEILKRPDGKLVGCGFIQFKLVQKAAKARHYTDHKPFLGRNILVDFAKSKDKFKKEKIKAERDIKEEPVDVKEEIKIEDDSDTEIKEENDNAEDEKNPVEDSDLEINSEDDQDNEDDNTNKRVISNDVNEGKTVFIKNVPFSATNEDLKQCMYQFGPIYYALICVDKFTEHSKGTAFVKFQHKEDAEKALQAGTELTLLGNILDCHPALGRNDVNKKVYNQKEQKKDPKDSRNLYLVKEGVILAGTKAAEGVSASDMAKRLQLEQYKTQMLRNLNMFVSKDRLVVHNLPPTWDDKKLRTLVQKFAGKGAVVRESKIMRDMKQLDADGIGASKEYGFVSFTNHENALTALRALNNNPNIFHSGKRPIVAFSIENKSMLNARQKRLEKSRQRNPKSKDFKPEEKTGGKKAVEKISRKKGLNKKRKFEEVEKDRTEHEFSGVTAEPGQKQKMRSRYKLTTQAQLHHENLKKEKKKQKFSKKSLNERKQDFIKQPKQKINKSKNSDNDSFSKLVNSYKTKLVNANSTTKSKWYD